MNEEKQVSYYAIIPASVRYDKDISANAKLLYGEITALCNAKGYCWATNQYFATLYKVSKKTVSRWISELADKGYINSYMRYKDRSREVDQRVVSITTHIPKNEDTYSQKCPYPIPKNVHTPIPKNAEDNTTSINTTFNNKYDSTSSCKQDHTDNITKEVINHLNDVAGTSYRHTTAKTISLIKARQRDGFSKQDFFSVIDKKYAEWKGTEWEKFIRPDTLFGTKFEGYLNQNYNTALNKQNNEKPWEKQRAEHERKQKAYEERLRKQREYLERGRE